VSGYQSPREVHAKHTNMQLVAWVNPSGRSPYGTFSYHGEGDTPEEISAIDPQVAGEVKYQDLRRLSSHDVS
jgi:hypothetical protein